MRRVLRPAASGRIAPVHIVCLPGAYHGIEDFLAAGFDVKVAERRLAIDIEFVDVELEHLGDRSALAQLRHDLVLPARAQGSRAVWLAGISLGGFIALDYAASNAGDLDGLCLLAPYLGNRMLTDEIARASDLATWNAGELAGDDEERRIWSFVQAHRGGPPKLYLGYGHDDRFSSAHRLLARTLPPEAVDAVSGGHDWRTWTVLWEHFLDSRFA